MNATALATPHSTAALVVDGLSWPALYTLAAAGSLPHAAAWLQRGAAPAPQVCAALCQGLGPRVGPGQQACRVVGWPASAAPRALATLAAGSAWVTQGFDDPQLSAPGWWAMDPQAAWPAAERSTARAARMHPNEVTPEMLAGLLAPLPSELRPALQAPAATLLAHWCSVHNLGVHWASLPAVPLLALRLGGLPTWQTVLSSVGLTSEEHAAAMAPWWRYLDLMLGRYLQLLGPDAALWLMSGSEADAALS